MMERERYRDMNEERYSYLAMANDGGESVNARSWGDDGGKAEKIKYCNFGFN